MEVKNIYLMCNVLNTKYEFHARLIDHAGNNLISTSQITLTNFLYKSKTVCLIQDLPDLQHLLYTFTIEMKFIKFTIIKRATQNFC